MLIFFKSLINFILFPGRTLRDWMKRLNIKSVFTHHTHKDGRSLSADSSDYNSEESQTLPPNEVDGSNIENVNEVLSTNAKVKSLLIMKIEGPKAQ